MPLEEFHTWEFILTEEAKERAKQLKAMELKSKQRGRRRGR